MILAEHNLGALDASGGVAGIDHKLGLLDNARVVVVGMIGHNNEIIVLAQIFQGSTLHLQVVLPPFADGGEIGIVVIHPGAPLL